MRRGGGEEEETGGVPFAKVESVGNDFVLIEKNDLPFDDEESLRVFAIKVCERRFGVGSDGLLVVDPNAQHPTPNTICLRMFNPDGTEDFCGNGLRCAAHYASERGWVGDNFTIEHHGRLVRTEITPSSLMRQHFPPASFDPKDVPLDEVSGELYMGAVELPDAELVVSSVTTGSTHTVLFVDELPRDEPFRRISSQLEHHPIFPERTSVIWVQVTEPHRLKIRIWERGVGETQGCGTGSMAAAVVHMRRAEVGGRVVVENTGGDIIVEAADWQSSLISEGTAELLFRGAYAMESRTP